MVTKEKNALVPLSVAAEHLNVSASALYKHVERNRLPFYRFGTKILFDLSEVRAAMKQQTPKGRP